MKTKWFKRNLLLSALCVLLIAASALTLSGCGASGKTPVATTTAVTTDASAESGDPAAQTFRFGVTFADGSTKTFDVPAVGNTVSEALLAEQLIAGENGAYGLYVQTVCGETHVYDEDGKYWAFYVDGAYAMSGVDATAIDVNCLYEFKAE